MAERIHVATQWLDECARQLDEVQAALDRAAAQLCQITLDDDSGADAGFCLNATIAGRRYTAQDVRGAIGALRSAGGAIGTDASKVARAAQASAARFQAAQGGIDRMIDRLMAGCAPDTKIRVPFGNGHTDIDPWWTTAEWHKYWPRPYHPHTVDRVFDPDLSDDGRYGAWQSAPYRDKAHYSDFYKIIFRNTHRLMTDDQLRDFLEYKGIHGCTYAATANEIMNHFRGRADDFERIFGYTMYDENGRLNYNMLMVDLFSFDRDNVSPRNRAALMTSFLNAHGLDSAEHIYSMEEMKAYFSILAPDGQFTTGGPNLVLKTMDGEYYMWDDGHGGQTIYPPGGHTVSVVGMTEDGDFIVSSWGRQFIMPAKDNPGFRFGYTIITG